MQWRDHRLPVVFFVGILLPGIALAVFSGRGLLQERRWVDQQIRDQLEGALDGATRDLEREFRDWQRALEGLAISGSSDGLDSRLVGPVGSWPERVRDAAQSAGSVVVLHRAGDALLVAPPGGVLYELPPSSTFGAAAPSMFTQDVSSVGTPDLELADAEVAELRKRDYASALQLYEGLLARAAPEGRPLLLHRLARTSLKAGAPDDAYRYYRELEQLAPILIGTVASDLVARFELCSMLSRDHAGRELQERARSLYGDLAAGHWSLPRPLYTFYSDSTWEWLEHDAELPDALVSLRAEEQRRRSLTIAVERFLETHRRSVLLDDGVALAFWQVDPPVALVLGPELVREGVLGEVVTGLSADGFEARWIRAGPGASDFEEKPMTMNSGGAVRDLSEIALPLKLAIWPGDPAAQYEDLRRRQNLYRSMLALVLALLAFGGYLTLRTVRREVEVARMKSEFVSAVSHEFRSPLTGIRQLGEMLLRGRVKNDEKRQAYYQMIVSESGRLTRLVENLLDFSRIEEGRKQYDLQPLESTEWLQQVVEEFRLEVADREVRLVEDVPENLPTLYGDREALTCAVHNLLDNAVKYSPCSATVRLIAEASTDALTVHVRDEGPGISHEDQAHVFEKFYRVSNDGMDEVKGAGLGLSLVQHIVSSHGGSVELDSRPGEGSTFSIRLPTEAPAPHRT